MLYFPFSRTSGRPLPIGSILPSGTCSPLSIPWWCCCSVLGVSLVLSPPILRLMSIGSYQHLHFCVCYEVLKETCRIYLSCECPLHFLDYREEVLLDGVSGFLSRVPEPSLDCRRRYPLM